MRIWIQLSAVVLIAAGCAEETVTEFRGGPARTADFGASGIAELEQIAWKTRLPAPIAAPPAVAGEHLYVADTSGMLTALSTADGVELWSVELGATSHAAPVVSGSRVLVGSDAGLHAVSREGQLLWTYAAAPVETAPIVWDGVAYVGARDHRVIAVDEVGGSLIWTAVTAGAVVSPGVAAGDDVLFGARDGGVYRLNRTTGEPRWSWRGPGPVWGLALDGDRLLVTAGTELLALDAASGERAIWRADLGARVETPPSVSGAGALAATGRGQLVGVDVKAGTVTFRQELGNPVRGDIVLSLDQILVPHVQGLVVLDRAGKARWNFRADGRVTGIVPAAGVLYVVDAEGSVYALR